MAPRLDSHPPPEMLPTFPQLPGTTETWGHRCRSGIPHLRLHLGSPRPRAPQDELPQAVCSPLQPPVPGAQLNTWLCHHSPQGKGGQCPGTGPSLTSLCPSSPTSSSLLSYPPSLTSSPLWFLCDLFSWPSLSSVGKQVCSLHSNGACCHMTCLQILGRQDTAPYVSVCYRSTLHR